MFADIVPAIEDWPKAARAMIPIKTVNNCNFFMASSRLIRV